MLSECYENKTEIEISFVAKISSGSAVYNVFVEKGYIFLGDFFYKRMVVIGCQWLSGPLSAG